MGTRGDRLKKAREKHFKSARQAAIALDVPVATYNAHEHAQQPGGRDYTPEEAQTYARRFGVRPEHLLMGASDKEASHDIPATCPLIGWVDIGDRVIFFPANKVVQVPTIEGAGAATAALELRNNPDFDRWLAFFDNVRHPMTPNHIGHTCVVALSDDSVYLRRIERARHRGWFHLVAKNEAAIMDVRPVWAARVRLMRER